MKKDTKTRILLIKDYLDKWNWDIAPLFMLSEQDALALMELLDNYEDAICKRAARYKERKE